MWFGYKEKRKGKVSKSKTRKDGLSIKGSISIYMLDALQVWSKNRLKKS